MQEKDYRIFPNFASQIKGKKPVQVYGTGNQTRTYCYITDAISGFIKTFAKGVPGEAYNIGNPNPEVSVYDVLQHIEDALNQSINYSKVEHPDSYPLDEPQRRCPDIRKANLQLNYKPKVNLHDGIRRYFSWTETAYTGKRD